MTVVILIPTLISLFYMGAWLSHWTEFLTVVPHSPPMVMNTALCFFLMGLNALAWRFSSLRWFRQAWIVVLLLSGLTGLQYLWNIQLGLDEIFVPAYLRAFRSYPGRMSPMTSISFTLLSLAWGSRVHFHREDKLILWANALISSCLVAMLGFLSLLEYGFAFNSSLSWGASAKISFASGFCFAILGAVGVVEILPYLWTYRQNPRALRSLLLGILGLMLSLAGWQYANYRASMHINQSLKLELENRYQQFYQAFHYRAEELQRTPIPTTKAEALAKNWLPPLTSIEAVAKVSAHPTLIWKKSALEDSSDLDLWAVDLRSDRPDFAFYPSFIFQRQRLMAFLFQDRLWIFSPQVVVSFFFPDDQFSYALKMDNGLVLATNTVGLISALKDWTVILPLRLWDDQLSIEVTPTKATLARLEPSTPQQFLLTGLVLTLLLAMAGYFFPMDGQPIKD